MDTLLKINIVMNVLGRRNWRNIYAITKRDIVKITTNRKPLLARMDKGFKGIYTFISQYGYITKNKYCKECAREKHKEIKRKTWLNNKDKYRPARQIEKPLQTYMDKGFEVCAKIYLICNIYRHIKGYKPS